ncbi:MAG: hypothetical protein OZX49_02648 [Immundisolibacter sp.]|nr:hypothetical protein [Immundisolibacter sp.]
MFVQRGAGQRAEAMAGHHVLVVPQPAQGGVDGVLAHRPVGAAGAGEHIPAAPGQRVQLAQDGQRLIGQRHHVRGAHLHLGGRYPPLGGVQVDFGPLGAAQLARTHEHQRRQAQGAGGDKAARVAVQDAQQLGYRLGMNDGGVVALAGRRQGAAQVAGQVTLGAAGGHGIAEHGAAVLVRPVRRFKPATGLDTAQHGQQLGCSDLAHRSGADPGEHVQRQALQNPRGVLSRPGRRELGVPLAGHGLEAVSILLRRVLRQLAVLARVDALGQQAAGLIAALARLCQRDAGIHAKGQALFLALESTSSATTCPQWGQLPGTSPRRRQSCRASAWRCRRALRQAWRCGLLHRSGVLGASPSRVAVDVPTCAPKISRLSTVASGTKRPHGREKT